MTAHIPMTPTAANYVVDEVEQLIAESYEFMRYDDPDLIHDATDPDQLRHKEEALMLIIDAAARLAGYIGITTEDLIGMIRTAAQTGTCLPGTGEGDAH